MKKFNRNRISRIESIVNDKSLENMDRRATLINTIRQGSKNEVLKVNDGWVTNKHFNAQRSQKELYQTIHCNFLSVPKKKNERFELGIKTSFLHTESSATNLDRSISKDNMKQ
jgi:hypothetical protein